MVILQLLLYDLTLIIEKQGIKKTRSSKALSGASVPVVRGQGSHVSSFCIQQ